MPKGSDFAPNGDDMTTKKNIEVLDDARIELRKRIKRLYNETERLDRLYDEQSDLYEWSKNQT